MLVASLLEATVVPKMALSNARKPKFRPTFVSLPRDLRHWIYERTVTVHKFVDTFCWNF